KYGQSETIRMATALQDDIVIVGFVEFTEGDSIESQDPILNLEASKTVFEMACPLTGKIVERNEAVLSEPSLLNSAKPEENWVIKLTDVDESAFNDLEEA